MRGHFGPDRLTIIHASSMRFRSPRVAVPREEKRMKKILRTVPPWIVALMMVWSLPAERASAQAEGADTLIIVHANVIDGVSNSPLMDSTVVATNGHIQSVGSGKAPDGKGRVIDLKGHWRLPGFVDSHMHVASLAAARR